MCHCVGIVTVRVNVSLCWDSEGEGKCVHSVGIEKVRQKVSLCWDNEGDGKCVTVLG